MPDDEQDERGRAVPAGRLARLARFGSLASGVAGNMLSEGARQIATGKRPQARDLLLTPGNINRVTDQLAQLRGAAMKLGQMVSMDSGEMLPPELTDILARLRDKAHHMPPEQLQRVLSGEWGKEWRSRFRRFDPRPIAAASIGQVHRAQTRDGRDLAIKVQYPGVRQSIESDVDNVASLLRLTGLLPKALDIRPLLEEAKVQLKEEADYLREGEMMTRYGALLSPEDGFVVPQLDEEFTTGSVLAMTYVEGSAIESLVDAPQEIRDAMMSRLSTLVLRELFEFALMQTDPNFANYRVQVEQDRLVLLDFGATRTVQPQVARNYHRLMMAALDRDMAAIREAAVEAGFMNRAVLERYPEQIDRMIGIILDVLHAPGPFDFGNRDFVTVLRAEGMEIAEDKATWHLPPPELIFAQRKISGTALLGARLKSRVDLRGLLEAYRDWTQPNN